MKVLFVGDPHVVASEFKDCWALIHMVGDLAKQCKPDYICLLGDLYHNHSVIDAEVMLFWDQALRYLTQYAKVICLKGNHDQPNNKVSAASSLLAHRGTEGVTIVDLDSWEVGNVAFCPYASSEGQLVGWSNQHPKAKTLVCHNTFQGATYDNGTIAHDYYNQELVIQHTIISGHIHTPMVLNGSRKVIYPGAPRWRTVSDANVHRSVLLVAFNSDGTILAQNSYSTSEACSPYFHLIDDESEPLDLSQVVFLPNARYVVDLKGSEAWIKERKLLFPNARIRAFPTAKAITLRESDGIGTSLAKWSDQFKPPNNTPKAILQERLQKLWPMTPLSNN